MASLASRAQGLGDKLSSIGQKMSLAFTLPIVGAGAFALKTAGEFEQTQIAFDTMLGSAEKSKAFLDTLFDFAANTPFEIGDLTDASKRLLAYGLQSQDIIPTLTDLGNITAGVGKEKLPFLITALGQVNTKTKLAGQELNQFIENGVDLLPSLSKITGHSIATITDQTKDLGITYAQVREALKMLADTKFYGLMSKQSKTLFGQWSNFKDQLTREAIEIGNIIAPYALKVLKFLQDILLKFKELSPSTKKWIVVIAALVASLGPLLILIGGITTAVGFMAASWKVLSVAAPIIAGITAALLALWVAYDDFAAYLEERPSLFGPVWEKMLQAVNWVTDKWNGMMQFFQDSLLVFKTDGGAILDAIKAQFATSFDNTAMESFATALGQIWDWLVKINDYLGVTDKITSVFKAMTGISGLEDAALNIQNRANEIDPNRSLRGGTPLYVNPVNIPPPPSGFVGPVQKKDVKLTQSINIKVDASESMEKMAEAIRAEASKMFGEQAGIISSAVEGGPVN